MEELARAADPDTDDAAMLGRPRRPRPGELVGALPHLVLSALGLRDDAAGTGFSLRLDPDLPIAYSSMTGKSPLAIAPAARGIPDAIVLLFPTASLEARKRLRHRMRRRAIVHRLRNPGHTLIFVCNTAREAELMREQGEVALAINHNIVIPDGVFRPLPPQPILYDAFYNARLAPFKRHELSLEIERCAFAYYHADQESAATDAALRERHRRLAPGHVFLNPIENGLPMRLSAAEINEVCNRSAVGLCLSAREGAMFASMEYLLSGLPIVSTPSLGGRDVYFEPDYCLIVEPDPRQIRDAVAALKARAIPRDIIASRTLAKLDRDRRRLLDLVDDLRERAGLARRNLPDWPWRDAFPLAWRPWDELLGALAPPQR